MSIPQTTGGAVKTPHEPTSALDHFATLHRAARDTQVRAALAVLNLFVSPTNAWRAFTATDLASALLLTSGTVNRHLRTLIRRGYLEERATHRRAGEREARLTTNTTAHTATNAPGAPGATR